MISGVEFAGVIPTDKPEWFTGCHAIKISDVLWSKCEPWDWPSFVPDALRYSWGWLDKQVSAWERAGCEIGMVLRSKDAPFSMRLTLPTYTPPPQIPTGAASAPPWDYARYGRWVVALVKRYRGRVRWYECESEQQDGSHWLGTAQDYLMLLDIFFAAVREADPRALVVCGGHTFADLLDDNPSESVINARLDGVLEPWRSVSRRSMDFGRTVLGMGLYDVIEIHSLSAPSGIGPAVARTREASGRSAPFPVWIGDATSAPLLTWDGGRSFNPPYPDLEAWKFRSALDAKDPAARVRRDAEQVAQVQAKIAAAEAAGCGRIYFCTLTDWPAVYGFSHMGLVNADGSARPALGLLR